MQVLVVEDSPDAAELLRTLLESGGHQVRVEQHGVGGLEAAIASRPQVALIDIGLPGIDGCQVAENLRGSAATRGIYLIAITGYGRPEDRARWRPGSTGSSSSRWTSTSWPWRWRLQPRPIGHE
jgi:CheY-like chemotaxis protein